MRERERKERKTKRASTKDKESEKERKKLEKFRKANKSNLFGLLFDSVKTISPDILSDLARSSFKTALHFEIRKLGR